MAIAQLSNFTDVSTSSTTLWVVCWKNGVFRDAEAWSISPEYGWERQSHIMFCKGRLRHYCQQRLQLMLHYFSSRQDQGILPSWCLWFYSCHWSDGHQVGVDEGTRFNHNANLQVHPSTDIRNTDLTAKCVLSGFYTIIRTPLPLRRWTVGYCFY